MASGSGEKTTVYYKWVSEITPPIQPCRTNAIIPKGTAYTAEVQGIHGGTLHLCCWFIDRDCNEPFVMAQ